MLRWTGVILAAGLFATGFAGKAFSETDDQFKRIIMEAGHRCDEVTDGSYGVGGVIITCKVGINHKDYHVSRHKDKYFVTVNRSQY